MKYLSFCIPYFWTLGAFGQTWVQLENFPSTERDDGCSFTIGNDVYCGTGTTPWWSSLGDFYRFDLNSETFSPIASLPLGKERQYATSFAKGSKGYITGGINGNTYLNDLWEYDSGTNNWIEKTPLPSVGRSGSAGFVLADTFYLLGGKSELNSALDEVWAYTISTDSWSQRNTLPFDGIWRSSAAIANDEAYVMLGKDSLGNYPTDLYKYNPISDQWDSISSFPGIGRVYSSLIAVSNRMFCFFGEDSTGSYSTQIWEFDFMNQQWEMFNTFPQTGRRGGICFSGTDAIYCTTGLIEGIGRTRETWKLDQLVSIDELDSRTLRVYPNPSSEMIYIDLPEGQIVSVELVTLDGKLLIKKAFTNEIDVSDIPTGIYTLLVFSKGEIVRCRVQIN